MVFTIILEDWTDFQKRDQLDDSISLKILKNANSPLKIMKIDYLLRINFRKQNKQQLKLNN